MRAKYNTYLLCNDDGDSLLLDESPVGWDSIKFNLIRDLIYLGIMKQISVELEFVGAAFRFMQRKRLLYGIDADIMIRQYINNPNTFLFEGKVNQENYNEDRKERKYRVDIVQSSFVQKFQNREDIVLNVLNNISLDRQSVTPAAMQNCLFRGKSIEFYSEFDGSSAGESASMYHHTIPFLLKVNGNPGVQAASAIALDNNFPDPSDYPVAPADLAVTDAAFYVNHIPQPQTIVLNWRINLTSVYAGELPYPVGAGGGTVFFHQRRIIIRVYDEDGNIDSIPFVDLAESAFGNYELTGNQTIVVPPLGYATFTNEQAERVNDDGVDEFDNFLQPFDVMDVMLRTEYYYNDLELTITQSSVVNDTIHPVVLPHELFSNIVAQINGGAFYSDVFGRTDLGYYADGEFAYLGITKGELLRGIDPLTVQIPTSMRDAFVSYSSVICLGAIITEKQIRVDPLDVLFNSNIATNIGEVNELAISPAKEFLFNSVKAGYPKNEYEQENGRDEFNTQYQYTNSFRSVKKELDLMSRYNGDGYGIEFARRASVITTGTADSRYDDIIFFVDMIKVGDELQTRRLEGILELSGIFSPETVINARIAAGQNMLRHRKYLNIPLHKKDKVYYFQSKDKNATLHLVTELGETIDGQDLDTGAVAYFLPDQRGFKCPITIEKLFEILANPLGLIQYSYKREDFFDYLFEVDAETDKNMGTWRTLGTRDTPVQVDTEVDTGNLLMHDSGEDDIVQHDQEEEDLVLYE